MKTMDMIVREQREKEETEGMERERREREEAERQSELFDEDIIVNKDCGAF